MKKKKESLNSKKRLISLFFVLLIFFIFFIYLKPYQTPPEGDEIRFLKTIKDFSEKPLIPSLSSLKNYSEIMTPLYFIIGGWIEKATNLGINGSRLISILASLSIIFLLWVNAKKQSLFIFAAGILFITPYYMALSFSAYTDMLCILFILLGIISFEKNKHILCALTFILAIATRQIAVAFPFALLIYTVFFNKDKKKDYSAIISLSVACLSLMFWIVLFKGLTPPAFIEFLGENKFIFQPSRGLYILAVLFANYFIFELIFLEKSILEELRKISTYVILLIIGALYLLTPIYESVGMIEFSVLGVLHQLIPWNIMLFVHWIFASLSIICVWKDKKISLILLVYSLIMACMVVEWDKYALPMIIILLYYQISYKKIDKNI